MSAQDQLLEMGCNPILVQAALKNVKSQDLTQLLDWITDHNGQEQKWTAWLKQNNEKQESANQGQSISHLVKNQMVQQLLKKGHSKNVAEKSLLMTGNTSIESAEKWIQEHKYDVDFEQPLLLQGTAQESTLTEEQAKAKLKQLTEKARQIRKQKQEEEAREREKNRIRYGKEMLEAKRIAEEQEIKRKLELDQIQKRKDQEYKQQLVEQMRRQKAEKLGKKIEEGGAKTQTSNTKPAIKLNKIQQVELQCQQVAVGMHAYPDKAKIFFDTAYIYVDNIIKKNGEEKTRKINKENKAFQERIVGCFGGVETLEVIGFVEEGGFLVMKDYDLGELQKILQVIQKYKNQY